MCGLERISATPSCPIKPIAERPLALSNSVNVDYTDHSSLKVHGKAVSLAGSPFAFVTRKPTPEFLSVGRKRREAKHARDFPLRLNFESAVCIRAVRRPQKEAVRPY